MKLNEIDKKEFVSRLDGSYIKKLQETFEYAYSMGYRDGMYQDLQRKDKKELETAFKKWIKAL